MISFKEYFQLVVEQNELPNELVFKIKNLPESKIGFFNDTSKLPQKPPYGFWVSKHGNFIPVFDTMGHSSEGLKVLRNIDRILNSNHFDYIKDPDGAGYFDTMGVMEDLGYCRVVKEGTKYDFACADMLTRGQKKFQQVLDEFYSIESPYKSMYR